MSESSFENAASDLDQELYRKVLASTLMANAEKCPTTIKNKLKEELVSGLCIYSLECLVIMSIEIMGSEKAKKKLAELNEDLIVMKNSIVRIQQIINDERPSIKESLKRLLRI